MSCEHFNIPYTTVYLNMALVQYRQQQDRTDYKEMIMWLVEIAVVPPAMPVGGHA
jgi:hypothetical protein